MVASEVAPWFELEPGDESYPLRVQQLANPPPKLYVMGEVPNGPAVAVVGARAADRQGIRLAYQLAFDVARAGVTVVSGGARGIDQAAHRGALDGGGRTVMVLGCGLAVDYPKGSAEIRERVRRAGALVSEFGPQTPPRRGNFPRRNRLMVELVDTVVVVQAGERSGALSTARYASRAGRPVLAVPGLPNRPLTRGTHALLRAGALLAETAADIVRALGGTLAAAPDEAARLVPTSGLGAEVVRWLEAGPATADELANGLGQPVGEVSATLVELELGGLVACHGGCYEKA